MAGHTLRRRGALLGATALLGGCDTVGGWLSNTPPPIPGEREAPLRATPGLIADEGAGRTPLVLPAPFVNRAWPMPGGDPARAPQHLDLPETLTRAWSADLGSADTARRRAVCEPVVGEGRVFAVDAVGVVTALDLAGGGQVWRRDLRPDEQDDTATGGGVALAGERLIATTAFAEAVALGTADGAEAWRVKLTAPCHGAPLVVGDRAIAVTVDNEVIALSLATGERLWTRRASAPTGPTLLGTPTPSAAEGIVVAALSTGELVALAQDTGRQLWLETLALGGQGRALSDLADIAGRPSIDRGRVLVVGAAGVAVSLELRGGRRIWERTLGSTQSAWIAGDSVFLMADTGDAVALSRDGRIRWATALPRYEDPERRRDPIVWNGPVVAGDRLILAGSNQEALSLSPFTGEVLGRIVLPGRARIAPVVVERTLLVQTDDARLTAFR